MTQSRKKLARRKFIQIAIGAGFSAWIAGRNMARALSENMLPLFDGRTLNGWLQIENDATSLSAGQIKDTAAFAKKLAAGGDPVSSYLAGRLDEATKIKLASYAPGDPDANAIVSLVVKQLNAAIAGQAFDLRAFRGVTLRPRTRQLLDSNLEGQSLARLNKMLLEDAYPMDLAKSAETGWIVKDGAMASTGSGRGVIYTTRDFNRFRLMLMVRHVSGSPDHEAGVLLFCTRPAANEMPIDALGGIQFRVPQGSHWDYRPEKENEGGAEFSPVTKTQFNPHEWSQVEILADAVTGRARMAVAQPPGTKAVEIVSFEDPTAGKVGPIALQMHNAGLFDEYKDLKVEIDPKEDRLLTVG